MKFEDIEIEEVDFEAMLEESFKKSESRSDLVTGTIVKIDEKTILLLLTLVVVEMRTFLLMRSRMKREMLHLM